ncbi:MAG: hypothetical protein KF838_11655 [Phycisphaeraceae bacterium]|nr:MAG: hypothetical protein KF838_11655 [Phycisphaeraceae bacterium]
MNARIALVALTLSALTTTAAHAGITGVAGQTTWNTSPSGSATIGAMQGFNAFAWDEQQGVSMTVAVDQTNNGPDSGAIPGVLSGTFDSSFIHFEAIPGVINASGSVTFSTAILGVIFTPLNLDNTDAPLGHSNVVYPTSYPFRGLGGFPPSTIFVAGNTLHFNFFSLAPSNHVVQVRVLTDSVPAPGALSLLGISGVVAARRRR